MKFYIASKSEGYKSMEQEGVRGEYCEICQSIIIGDSCTNKKCQNHVKGTEYATYKQVNYIQDMLKRLDDDTEYDYKSMTQKEASRIIEELQERLELGE